MKLIIILRSEDKQTHPIPHARKSQYRWKMKTRPKRSVPKNAKRSVPQTFRFVPKMFRSIPKAFRSVLETFRFVQTVQRFRGVVVRFMVCNKSCLLLRLCCLAYLFFWRPQISVLPIHI